MASSQSISDESMLSSGIHSALKGIDPVELSQAMGGSNEPPEEPLLSTPEEGYGYFPSAIIGNGVKQYGFLRKLGWSGHSTVWLARDTSSKEPSYVALKLLTVYQSAMVGHGHCLEYKAFKKIESAKSSHPGLQHCLTLKDSFHVNSAAGQHMCFVTDVLTSNLQELRPPGRETFPLPIAKRIIKQLLLALDYLHRECGYTHADIKPDNILAKLPDPVVPRIEAYLQACPPMLYGPPLPLKASTNSSMVFSRSQPIPFFELDGTLEDIAITLVDYGEAIPIDSPLRSEDHQPKILRAPEVTLGYPWSSGVDIWTVGCMLFGFLTNQNIFGQPGELSDFSTYMQIQNIIESFGPFPKSFLDACPKRADYFNKDGSLLRSEEYRPTSVEELLRFVNTRDEADIPGVATFIRRCMTIDPRQRPSAQELLKDGWLES